MQRPQLEIEAKVEEAQITTNKLNQSLLHCMSERPSLSLCRRFLPVSFPLWLFRVGNLIVMKRREAAVVVIRGYRNNNRSNLNLLSACGRSTNGQNNREIHRFSIKQDNTDYQSCVTLVSIISMNRNKIRLTVYVAWTDYSDVRRVLKFKSILCLCKLLWGGITQSAEERCSAHLFYCK